MYIIRERYLSEYVGEIWKFMINNMVLSWKVVKISSMSQDITICYKMSQWRIFSDFWWFWWYSVTFFFWSFVIFYDISAIMKYSWIQWPFSSGVLITIQMSPNVTMLDHQRSPKIFQSLDHQYVTSLDLWSNIIAMEWPFPHICRLLLALFLKEKKTKINYL